MSKYKKPIFKNKDILAVAKLIQSLPPFKRECVASLCCNLFKDDNRQFNMSGFMKRCLR